jgi:hypothetical protein
MNFGIPDIAAVAEVLEIIFYSMVVVAAFSGGYLVGKCRV